MGRGELASGIFYKPKVDISGFIRADFLCDIYSVGSGLPRLAQISFESGPPSEGRRTTRQTPSGRMFALALRNKCSIKISSSVTKGYPMKLKFTTIALTCIAALTVLTPAQAWIRGNVDLFAVLPPGS